MNIFYSQILAANSFEGAVIGKFYGLNKGMICFNRNIIKCYLINDDDSLLLVFSDYLFENIIQIERFEISKDEDGFVVCFESSKISLVSFSNYFPVIESLKYFEREEFDVRKQDIRITRIFKHLGISKISKYYFSIFSLNEILLRTNVYKFTDINEKIKNVIDFVFLENYNSPTVCLIYNPRQCSYIHKKEIQAIIFSYDIKLGTFNILEEFQVPQDTHKILFSKFTMAFISHNDIVLRTSNSCYFIGLNKMSQNQDKKIFNVVLNNEQMFFRDETLIIINGDGQMYKINIQFDSKRIIDIEFKHICKLIVPKFISEHDCHLFIGSNESSLLFKIISEKSTKKKRQIPFNKTEDNECIEYRNLYHDETDSLSILDIKLEFIDEFYGLGCVNDIFLKSPNEFYIASEGVFNYVQKLQKKFDLGNLLNEKQMLGFERMMSSDRRILCLSKNKTREINECFEIVEKSHFNIESKTLCLCTFGNIEYQITDSVIYVHQDESIKTYNFEEKIRKMEYTVMNNDLFFVSLDMKNKLIVLNKTFSKLEEVQDVNSFSLLENKCYIIVSNDMIVYDLFNNAFVLVIKDLLNFEKQYKKLRILGKSTREENEFVQRCDLNVIDIGERKYVFIINSYGECAIYLEFFDFFLKVNSLEKFLKFDMNKPVLIAKFGNFLFLNTISPVALYIKRNEVCCYDLDVYFNSMVSLNNSLIIMKDDIIYNFQTKHVIPSCHIHTNELIFNNKCKCKEDKIKSVNDTVLAHNYLNYDKYITIRYPIFRTPKNIVCVKNYHVVASCERETYKQDDNIDQGINVETYRFYIDLYSKDFQIINSYQLDTDEYVFDVKYLSLNDPIGKEGKSDFLIVCTTKIEGEDKQSRGRLIAFEITSIVADKENTYKDKKLKLFATENIKGCITKCDEVKGNISVCLGIKLMVYKIDRSEGLVPIAIHDLYTLSTSILSIKNYLLVSDIYRGISFYYYQKRPIRLNLLCTSDPIKEAVFVDLMINNTDVSFICADVDGNFHIYSYTPNNILSEGGTKMIKRYHLRTHLGLMLKKESKSKLDASLYISETNMIVNLTCISSKVYIMLFKIQSQVLSKLKSSFGLHPLNYFNTTDHTVPSSLKKPIVRFLIEKLLTMSLTKRKFLIKESDVSEDDFNEFLISSYSKI